ncbi:rolling circle replication-associated protein [Variovorax sp. 160MFSha2.1]|uniref:rolling circle replication-associated protein n=1 Tax=Variovorax sp. 160MFSha2.1 TaxID=3158367 RepID=UPI003AB01C6E
MQRIVDGIAYEGKYVDDAYDVRVWECNGHREISAQRVIEWHEIGPAPDWESILGEKDPEREEADAAERKEAARKRNASRAKTTCRRFIKSMGFNELLTLTYRENQTDEALCKKHARAFFRRMSQLIPGFGYCAGYEPQQRGAWHVHAAVYKLPEFVKVRFPAKVEGGFIERKVPAKHVGTMVWRAIVGKDNGLCFVGGKKAGRGLTSSLAKMAAYVSKYILKHAELFPEGKQRYTHSKGDQPLPKSVATRFTGVSLLELIPRCFWLEDGEVIVTHHIGRWRDSYYLCTELIGQEAPC